MAVPRCRKDHPRPKKHPAEPSGRRRRKRRPGALRGKRHFLIPLSLPGKKSLFRTQAVPGPETRRRVQNTPAAKPRPGIRKAGRPPARAAEGNWCSARARGGPSGAAPAFRAAALPAKTETDVPVCQTTPPLRKGPAAKQSGNRRQNSPGPFHGKKRHLSLPLPLRRKRSPAAPGRLRRRARSQARNASAVTPRPGNRKKGRPPARSAESLWPGAGAPAASSGGARAILTAALPVRTGTEAPSGQTGRQDVPNAGRLCARWPYGRDRTPAVWPGSAPTTGDTPRADPVSLRTETESRSSPEGTLPAGR